MQSKPFVIATEGPTIDGRNISREWIEQMAKTYSPKVYTAVANLEHYLSSLPDSVFGAYGQVVSLSTQETDIMGEKKLQLLAVVDANPELVALQKKGKKAFASMEVIANFCNKGMAYLSGLAFTDKPASLGTESMKFSIAGASGDRYAFDQEVAIEFYEDKPDTGASLFAKVKELLGLGKKDADARFADQGKAIEAIALSQKGLLENFASIEQQLADQVAGANAAKEVLDKISAEFAVLKQKLGNTDGDDKGRPPATGVSGRIKPDC